MASEESNATSRPEKHRVGRLLRNGILLLLLLIGAGIAYLHRPRAEMIRELAALKARGYKTSLLELETEQRILPDDRNLSVAVIDAATDLEEGWSKPLDKREDNPANESPGLEAINAWRSFVTNHVDFFERGQAFAQREPGGPRLNYMGGAMMLLPHLSKYRDVTRAYGYRARLAGEEGRPADAAADILTMLRISRCTEDEPILISQLVRIAICSSAAKTAEKILNRVAMSETILEQLQSGFMRVADQKLMHSGISGELAIGVAAFSNGAEGMITAMGDMDSNPGGNGVPLSKAGVYLYAGLGFLKDEQAIHVHMLSRMMEILRMPHWEQEGPMQTWERDLQQMTSHWRPGALFSPRILPALSNASKREGDHLAQMQVTVAGIAVERYRAAHGGSLPETLHQLVPAQLAAVPLDPFDGKPLRYAKLGGNSWVVYSVGPDRTDDAGAERRKGASKAPYDVTFGVERD